MRHLLCLAALLFSTQAHAGCGPDPEPCQVDGGTYHVVLPEGPGPFPAVLFLHGWGGSGMGSLSNTGMVAVLTARGYAVIAPDGLPREGRNGRTWAFYPDAAAPRDEPAFLAAVADDAAARFGLQRDRMVLSGFSIGGSMVSYAACARPGDFAAYAPVAGSFWRPQPTACAGPVRLLQTHGWSDGTVPLEGRVIGPDYVQGDVFQALDLWRATNLCAVDAPDETRRAGNFQVRSWTDCAPDSALDFALHPGGHGVPPGWATLMLDWFEAL